MHQSGGEHPSCQVLMSNAWRLRHGRRPMTRKSGTHPCDPAHMLMQLQTWVYLEVSLSEMWIGVLWCVYCRPFGVSKLQIPWPLISQPNHADGWPSATAASAQVDDPGCPTWNLNACWMQACIPMTGGTPTFCNIYQYVYSIHVYIQISLCIYIYNTCICIYIYTIIYIYVHALHVTVSRTNSASLQKNSLDALQINLLLAGSDKIKKIYFCMAQIDHFVLFLTPFPH